MNYEIPSENERKTADPEYKNFLMKILIWKIALQTPLWWSCTGLMIWLVGYLFNNENNALYWLITFILSYLGTFLVILCIAYPIGRWYYNALIKNHWWVLGDSVIYVNSGVLTHQLARIPYGRIQNLNTKSKWFDRRGGYFRVEIETAGRSGTYISEGTIFGIKNPEEVIKKIAQKIKETTSSDVSENLEKVELPQSNEITEILKKIYEKLASIEDLLKKK